MFVLCFFLFCFAYFSKKSAFLEAFWLRNENAFVLLLIFSTFCHFNLIEKIFM